VVRQVWRRRLGGRLGWGAIAAGVRPRDGYAEIASETSGTPITLDMATSKSNGTTVPVADNQHPGQIPSATGVGELVSMSSDRLTVTVTSETVDDVENALKAAAQELGGELDRSRGRCRDDEISTGEALAEVARAYTGWTYDE